MTTQPAGEHRTGTLASPISDDLVADATKAGHQLTDDEWHGMSDSAREYASTSIRRALEAAYPAIRQQVAEQIAAALEAEAKRHTIPTASLTLDGVAATIARQIGRGEAL